LARQSLPGELEAIRKVSDGRAFPASRIAELQRATTAKLDELAETIALHRAGKQADALAVVQTNRGKQIMDGIRQMIASMNDAQENYLRVRLETAIERSRWLNLGAIVTLLGLGALAIAIVASARKRFSEVQAAYDDLEATNRRLAAEIEQRQRAEGQVRQMQKMEAIGQLTGGIAHDFNNMLAVVISAMNLAQRKLARGETDLGKFVDSAIEAAQRGASLTARLLAFARQQPLSPSVIDANKLVSGMSELLRRTLGETIGIETVLAGGLWRARADAGQLENAVLNLCVNARDAMPDGGRLTIETANCYLDDSYAAEHYEVPAGQYVLVAVTDTGSGMSREIMASAFDPFFTTKPAGKGTGLGLSQVFGFVKQSGGHVKIYSEPGQGTTVKIYLPRSSEETAQDVVLPSPTLPGGRPVETILLVEDDERVRVLGVETLRDLGYTVVHAGNGESALAMLDRHPEVSLLFTDVVMPGGSGRKLAEAALARHPGLKVLYTTGFTRNAVVHNGVLDHGVDFIAKPFTVEQLARKVREILDRKG
jgi:signal transduction histidine kinase